MSKESDILNWVRKVGGPLLGIRVRLNTDFSLIWKGAFSASSTMTIRGLNLHGNGYGSSPEQAVIVAVAEIIERCTLANYNGVANSSNGFAVHSDLKSCQQAACFELLERDAYLCHHLTRTPFQEIELSGELLKKAPTILDLLDSGVELRAGRMNALGAGHGGILVASGKCYQPQFGVVLATAYSLGLDSALEKAAREVMSTLAFRTVANLWESIDSKEFIQLKKPGPRNHGHYSLYQDKDNWLRLAFCSQGRPLARTVEIPRIYIEELELPSELLNPPFVACRAVSEHLQPLYFGMAKKSDLNFTRLSEFMGRDFEFFDHSEPYPHLLD